MSLNRTVETELTTEDGHALHVVDHQVPYGQGTVLLVHGLGEHSGCYGHIVDLLNSVGLSVVRFDQRGHGVSTGTRGHISTYNDYLNDVSLVVDHLLHEDPYRLITLFGHSMGGGVVANWCLRRMPDQLEDQITGAILSAPWFRLATPPSALKTNLIHGVSLVWPEFSVPTSIRSQELTRSEEILEKLRNDELRHNRITMKTAIECHQAGEWALQNAAQFPVPVLAFHGTSDVITSCEATYEFCQAAPAARFVPLDEFIHEPHNDPRWREIFNHVIDWTLKRFPRSLAA
ncbi:lysophospholipase [Thalassoglobus sp. JC818]|uniref:alpha/beta hydrolase n=1 Tax=Thalassoglobus sp. JC818 TaxID=3232136 RepID=UPI00345826EB